LPKRSIHIQRISSSRPKRVSSCPGRVVGRWIAIRNICAQPSKAASNACGWKESTFLQLHTVDPTLAYSEQIGALVELQREGKIRHIGVSNVDI
jgi:hypothetical protein